MSSTFGSLNIAVRGLLAQQASLDTVGHNISNANTAGYSRQRVNLITTNPSVVYGANGQNQIGTGVDIQSITRARNTFIDKQMWKESATLGRGVILEDSLGQIESIFTEPVDTGIQGVLDKFWSSWQTLSANASDTGTRTVVRERGVALADAITLAKDQLRDMVSDTNSVINLRVKKINQISSEILSLNKKIVTVEAGGNDHANDLRDRRDYLVDQLSSIAKVHVAEEQSGSYTIQMSGITLVDYNSVTKLDTKDNTASGITQQYGWQAVEVYAQDSTQPMVFTDGEMKGLIDSRDSTESGMLAYLDKLSTMSKFLLKEFNATHRAGYGTDNSTNNNFFGDPAKNYATDATLTTNGQWINELKVSPDLFTTDGLKHIAAKTNLDQIIVRQSNALGGSATVNSTYTSETPQAFTVKIVSTIVSGTDQAVNTIQYSTDGGNTYSSTITSTDVGTPKTFTIYTNGTQSVTISMANDADNKAGDTYTFSVNKGNASGDNAVKLSERLKVAVLGDIELGGNGISLYTYYNSLIGTLGTQKENATRLTDNQTTLVQQISNWREEVSGINMDEEMADMVRFQKGYNAAARILTTMDEMLDKLINGTGVVGR